MSKETEKLKDILHQFKKSMKNNRDYEFDSLINGEKYKGFLQTKKLENDVWEIKGDIKT